MSYDEFRLVDLPNGKSDPFVIMECEDLIHATITSYFNSTNQSERNDLENIVRALNRLMQNIWVYGLTEELQQRLSNIRKRLKRYNIE